jgi:hypothetical protein
MLYEQFTTKLNGLGQDFDVQILHEKRIFVPVYEDPTDQTTFTGEMHAVYDEIPTSEITNALFPEDHINQMDYKFSKGDYCTVTVKSTLKSKAQILKESIWNINSDSISFFVRLSGRISNETP